MSTAYPSDGARPMPKGPVRRRQRLSDEETRQRTLDAALGMVNRSGLTVGLDHISFEEVIREAGVSRTAAYRHWPYKDLFFGDLLRELARGAAPASAVSAETSRALLGSVLAGRLDRLGTVEGRHQVVVEMLRVAAVHDYEAVLGSTEWRTYLALQATFHSLPDGELREEIKASLAASERRFVERVAEGWRSLTGALGYRIRPETGAGFDVLATLVTASLRGLVLMALADGGLVRAPVLGDPLGSGEVQEWSPVGLSAAGVATAFLEPDPDVVWDDARLRSLRDLLGG